MFELYRLIRQFEGCRLRAYLCPAGVWTIGWGATGAGIGPGTEWTQEQADKRLESDALAFARGALALCPLLSGNAHAAIADFAFNLGLGRLRASTLRRRLNVSDMDGASVELKKWVRGGGRVLPGLVARRAAEAALLR